MPRRDHRDGLAVAVGIDLEHRRRRVGDHRVLVLGLGDREATVAQRELEQLLDLVLGELPGPERVAAGHAVLGRLHVRRRLDEHHGAVAVEREVRHVGGEELDRDEPAGLVEAEDDPSRRSGARCRR